MLADSGPFLVVAAPRTTRSSSGGTDTVRVEQTLMCLDRGCAPSDGARRVSLPAARATQGTATATAQAPPLTVVPRVPKEAVKASRAVYRRDAGVAGFSIPGALVPLLVAVAVAVGTSSRRRWSSTPSAARSPAASPSSTRSSARSACCASRPGRPAPDRRRAADLAGASRPRSAAAARWPRTQRGSRGRRPEPEPTDVGKLFAEEIEPALRGGR